MAGMQEQLAKCFTRPMQRRICVISRALKLLKWSLIASAVVVGMAIGMRTHYMQRGLPLELWHSEVPHELSRTELRMAD